MPDEPKTIRVLWTSTSDNPPADNSLFEGQMALEAADPLRLWVGVPTDVEANGKRVLVDAARDMPVSTAGGLPVDLRTGYMWYESGTTTLNLNTGTVSSPVIVPVGGQGYIQSLVGPAQDAADDAQDAADAAQAAADAAQATANSALTTANAALPKSGGTMTGPIVLAVDPASALNPATKQYTDAADALAMPKTGGTFTGAVVLAGAPTTGLNPATKTYTDTADALLMPKAGGTFTGTVVLAGDPAAALQPATKQYVDTADALLMPKAGGTFTGTVVLAGDPTADLEAATKQYVDDAVAGGGGGGGGGDFLPLTGGTLTGNVTIYYPTTTAGVIGYTIDTNGGITEFWGDDNDKTAGLYHESPAGTGNYAEIYLEPVPGDYNANANINLFGSAGWPATIHRRLVWLDSNGEEAVVATITATDPDADWHGDGLQWSGKQDFLDQVTVAADPTVPLGVATKQYVDDNIGSGGTDPDALPKAGGTMTGNIVLVGDATSALHPATKQQLDAVSTVANAALPKAGGTMTGAITLSGAPTSGLHATTKTYVDAIGTTATDAMPKSGGTFTGAITLSGDGSSALHPASKQQLDTVNTAAAAAQTTATAAMPKSGGTFTGAITLSADGSSALHPASKQQLDTVNTAAAAAQTTATAAMPKSGGTFTGAITLSADGSSALHPASKQQLDAVSTTATAAMPKAGGTFTGAITLSADGSSALHPASKQQLDAVSTTASAAQTTANAALPKAGGTMTGAITLSGDGSSSLHPASKQQLDAVSTVASAALPKAGGTMTGAITLSGDGTSALHPASKQQLDTVSTAAMPKSGGTFTGLITLSAAPTSDLHAATKKYVDDNVGGGGASVSIDSTAPSSPSSGDLWWHSEEGRLYIYYDDGTSSQWVPAEPFSQFGMVLATYTGSSSTSFDFALPTAGIFSRFEFDFAQVKPATASELRMLFSLDDGSSFATSGYLTANAAFPSSGSALTNGADTGQLSLSCNQSVETTKTGVSGSLKLYAGAGYIRPEAIWDTSFMTDTTVTVRASGGGRLDNGSAITDVRVSYASGNIASGRMKVRGFLT